MSQCVEPIVGKILAGWRYDISGIAPEMRGDYEAHFTDCEHCHARRPQSFSTNLPASNRIMLIRSQQPPE